MNILFIGYWGVNEGLSVATIDPHLKILSQFSEVEEIIYVSIERSQEDLRSVNITKVQHIPFYSGTTITSKFRDYIRLPHRLVTLCYRYQIDVIICRSAPAGALGYLVWKKTKVPFCVESFEPHADYMLESGVWNKFSPYYLCSKYWESKQKEHSMLLIPVANNYRHQLIGEGVEEHRIKIVPCTVDLNKFEFSSEQRSSLRKELRISNDAVVGVYVGKYGGIYMDEGAFKLYQDAFHHWPDFFLIILSPRQQHEHIRQQIDVFFLPKEKVIVREVPHWEVPVYLSVADFGFATIKPSESRAYCSAIKIGEYWANGLPVALTEGVGDDAEMISREALGVLIRRDNFDSFFIDYSAIQLILSEGSTRKRIQRAAKRYRHRDKVRESYSYLIEQYSKKIPIER